GHHLDVAAPGDGAPASGGQRAIEDRHVLVLDVRRAVDFAVLVDVADDFAGLFGRVAELHQRLRHGVVDDLDDAAADELLVLHQREVWLDARSIAIHHKADGAGGGKHGDLGVLEAELFAVIEGGIPRALCAHEQIGLYVFRLDAAHGVAVHADDVEHGLAIYGVAGERSHLLGVPRGLRVGLAAHQRGDAGGKVATLGGTLSHCQEPNNTAAHGVA